RTFCVGASPRPPSLPSLQPAIVAWRPIPSPPTFPRCPFFIPPRRCLRVTSDRGQLQQVFLNLVGNAVQATAEGGRVEVTLKGLDGDFAEVSVADTGCGMSREVVSHIFEPFYTTKKENGHGLGLFITYGIVRRLGGEIAVESEEGKGTTFTVAIPYVKPEKQA
ncbi:MAG: ATP-binding protein, partial [Desulfovibrio sp.]|nr:ATP-binding protein [Desulfovibrio sp.]